MRTVSTSAEPQAIGATDKELATDEEVGEYRIEAVIGRGGFGTVYRAVHPVIGKSVAIKVLARRYSADPQIVSRFVAEARAVNQIRHRNIIDIFAFGQLVDGRHYYVMELLDGETLDHAIETHGPMPLARALPVLRAIARALDAAHAKGIAHRDLKPENIFLAHDPDGEAFPKLLDFGIAKLLAPDEDVRHHTNTGVPIGTPYYMSPEQCRGRDVDHRTDIYSFGVVAYRVLTGGFAFEGNDYLELLFKQIHEEPPPPSSKRPELGPRVDAAIAWMMKKAPAERPPNLVEAVAALDPSATTTPGSMPPMRPSIPNGAIATPRTTDPFASTTASPPMTIPAVPPRRSRVMIAVIAGVACLAIGVAIVIGARGEPANPVARPAVIVDASAPAVAVAVVAPVVEVDAPVAPKLVHVRFRKLPAHARVVIDGKPSDPADVALPAGDRPVTVSLEAPGYQPRSIALVPDRDQDSNETIVAVAPTKVKPPIQPHDQPHHDDHDTFHTDEIFGSGHH